MGLLSSVWGPPAGSRLRAIRDRRRGTARRSADGTRDGGALSMSQRPSLEPSTCAGRPGSGTFDRTRTCDDLRSWGERRQEYTVRTSTRKRSWRRDRLPDRERGHGAMIGALLAQAVGSSTSMLRVRFGSTGMPGPIVVETVTFLRYRPLADEGLARRTSSSAAA